MHAREQQLLGILQRRAPRTVPAEYLAELVSGQGLLVVMDDVWDVRWPHNCATNLSPLYHSA